MPFVDAALVFGVVLVLGCEPSSRAAPVTPAAVPATPRRAAIPGDESLAQLGKAAYERGEFEQAAELLQGAWAEAPSDWELGVRLARAWIHSERNVEAEDLIGDLLLAGQREARRTIETDPLFDSEAFSRLLATAGVTSLAQDEVPTAALNLDDDGREELFVVSQRGSREDRFLALVVQAPEGPFARRLIDVALRQPRVTALHTAKSGCALLLEELGGNAVEAELHLLWGATATNTSIIYSKHYILDGGDVEEPPPVDGALSLSVIDVVEGGEPELVLTWVDPLGEPQSTEVLEIGAGQVKSLGDAKTLRDGAAKRLRSKQASLTRPIAEALARLQPDLPSARLALLGAPNVPTPSEWWGFYAPDSNEFIAMHSAYYARHADLKSRAALAKVPSVARFLARWTLTTEELATQTEPLIPPGPLWGRAPFLEPSDASTVLSYFRLAE